MMGIYCTHYFYFNSDAKWETIHVAVLMTAQNKPWRVLIQENVSSNLEFCVIAATFHIFTQSLQSVKLGRQFLT